MPQATRFVTKDGRKYIGNERRATETTNMVLELIERMDEVEKISLGPPRYINACEHRLAFSLNQHVIVLDVRPCHIFQRIQLKVSSPSTVLATLQDATALLNQAGLRLATS